MDDAAFDYGKWRFFFELFLFGWNIILGIWLWISRKNKDLLQRMSRIEDAFEGRMTDNEKHCLARQERITKLEAKILGMPSHDDLGRIYDRINTLSGDVREMKGTLESASKSVERLHQYLLEHDRT